jgi:hypothetical protein
MTVVIKAENGYEPIGGNPTLTSLDGEERAPLAVLLHPSWTDKDRARFGIYVVEPMVIPEGKDAVGMPRYELRRGRVFEVRDLQDLPLPKVSEPSPIDLLRSDLEVLAQRVAALEARR